MPTISTAARHAVTVKALQFGQSEKTTPFVQLSFENDKSETIDGWLYLSEKTFERTVGVLRECFGFDDNFDTLEGQVVGKRCSITTEMESFEGKDRLKVKWVNPEHTAPKAIENQSEFLKSLSEKAARLTRSTPASASSTRTPAPRPPAAAPVPRGDEDIPF